MNRCLRMLVAAAVGSATLVAGSLPSAGAATGRHVYRTWTDTQGIQASPLIGTSAQRANQPAIQPAGGSAAGTFAGKVGQAWPQVAADLGTTLVSAALDQTVGNRLVVRVTGAAADVSSPALDQLDGNGGEVRVIEHQVPRAAFDAQFATAKVLLGTTVGRSHILRVSRDDMAERIVVGVDRDSADAQRVMARVLSLAVVTVVPPTPTTDGGTWGTNPARAKAPVAGGDTIWTANSGCTSALPAVRSGTPVLISAGHCAYATSGSTYLATNCSGSACVVQPAIGSWVQSRAFGDTIDEAVLSVVNQGPPRNCIVTQRLGAVRSRTRPASP